MNEESNRTPKIFIVFGFLFLYLAGSQIHTWGKQTPAIFKAKFAKFFGAASTDDYNTLGMACAAMNNPDCAREAFTEVYRARRDPEVIAIIANTYYSTKNHKEAEHHYLLYYKAGGTNVEHAFYYGRVLEKLGQRERAVRAYQLSLQNRQLKTTKAAVAALKRLTNRTPSGRKVASLPASSKNIFANRKRVSRN